MYAKIEEQRLNFIRFDESTIMSDSSSGIHDTISRDDCDIANIGKRIYLPDLLLES